MAAAAETLSFPTGALTEKKEIATDCQIKKTRVRIKTHPLVTWMNLPSRVAAKEEPKNCQQ